MKDAEKTITQFALGFESGFQNGFQNGFNNGLISGEEHAKRYLNNNIQKSIDLTILPWKTNRMPFVDAIICAGNEAETIRDVILQVKRIPEIRNILVIVNGTTDDTDIIAINTGAQVIKYPKAIGYDVGRAIGAMYSDAAGLLFLDGDIVIDALELVPFIEALADGVDVGLNDITPFITPGHMRHSVTIGKHFLNMVAKRPDLKGNSLVAIPHVLSRRAVTAIKPENLAVPPKAQIIAIQKGLDIQTIAAIDVLSTNRIRPDVHLNPDKDLVEHLILGDHLEALEALIQEPL